MKRLTLLGLALFLTACASFRPGSGVTRSFAASWGCDYQKVMAEADRVEARLSGPTMQFVPQVGWDACDLLAHNGAPTRIDRQQTAHGRSMSWWYQSSAETHLVRLEQRGAEWVVAYVGW